MNNAARTCLLSLALFLTMDSFRADGGDVDDLTGYWRAELASPGGPLPFGLRFEVRDEKLRAWLLNGPEEIEVPRVDVKGDEISMSLPHYDSSIVATSDEQGYLAGKWRRRRNKTQFVEMDFTARPSQRNDDISSAAQQYIGRWRVAFAGSADPAVAVVQEAEGGYVWSTFLTTTGDYRYLRTTASGATGNHLQMSCFDGAHAFLFKATRQPDGDLKGDFWSRDSWHETWTATRDETVSLPSAFAVTRWNEEFSLPDLTFPDLDGNPRAMSDLMGQATIVEIFGSWCPNCHDAGQCLSELYDEYHARGLSVIGLAFELTGDFERDANQVRIFTKRHEIRYPSLLVGLADKAKATEQFGALDKIRSYPTFLFVDQQGTVQAIYSGFSGPATGIEHERLTRQFRQHIEELLEIETAAPAEAKN